MKYTYGKGVRKIVYGGRNVAPNYFEKLLPKKTFEKLLKNKTIVEVKIVSKKDGEKGNTEKAKDQRRTIRKEQDRD